MPNRDMLDSIIYFMIKESFDAKSEIELLAKDCTDAWRRLDLPKLSNVQDKLTQDITFYIWSAIDWNRDLEPRIKGSKKVAGLSRRRLHIIQQLKELSRLASPKHRARSKPILPDVIEILQNGSPLGHAMLVPYSPEGIDPPVNRVVYLTEDLDAASRHLGRIQASASSQVGFVAVAGMPLIPSDILQVIDEAARYARSTAPDLRSVKKKLRPDQREVLATLAEEAARALEREFEIDSVRNNQSTETLATWKRPRPLEGFATTIFETFAPIIGWNFEDIAITKRNDRWDALTHEAKGLVKNATTCAHAVFEMIVPQLEMNGISIDKNLRHDPFESDEDFPIISRHYLDTDSPVTVLSEDKIGATDRLHVGRNRVVSRVWRMRNDVVILRGFSELFHWTVRCLWDRPAHSPELPVRFQTLIVNPIDDWHHELSAQYQEGNIDTSSIDPVPEGSRDRHKRAKVRRIGGLPLEMPEMPELVRDHRLQKERYGRGKPRGAKQDDKVVEALLAALDERDVGESRVQLWQEAKRALQG
jgi:hypothetical protein